MDLVKMMFAIDLFYFKQGQMGNGLSGHNNDVYSPVSIYSERNYGVVQIAISEGSVAILQSNSICFGKQSSDINVCSGKGICADENQCQCDIEYTGNYCQYAFCNNINASLPNVCSGKGTCIDTNNCSCLTGASGTNCENYLCFGVNSNSEIVCSSFGVCTTIDTCNCTLRHLGNNCEYNIGNFNLN
jgi:hypothetical protein